MCQREKENKSGEDEEDCFEDGGAKWTCFYNANL